MYRRGECTGKRIIFAQGEGGGGVGAALRFWPTTNNQPFIFNLIACHPTLYTPLLHILIKP